MATRVRLGEPVRVPSRHQLPCRRLPAWLVIALLASGLLLPAAPALAGDRSSAAAVAYQRRAAPVGSLVVGSAPRSASLRALTAPLAPAAAATASLTARSVWQVQYDASFLANDAARGAFQAAVDVWASVISSPVPIVVDARFEPKQAGLLGQAGPSMMYAFSGLGDGQTFYPSALADAIYGSDVSALPFYTGAPVEDISASFSSTETHFYFGTDGAVPSGQLDFMSVVMHELGHGLGLVGSADGSQSVGQISDPPTADDRFVRYGASTNLLSVPNPSTTLGSYLRSNNLFWNGAAAAAANSGVAPKLYAPNPWEPGSSYAHLDESTYVPTDSSTINALMTPSISMQEVHHSPGPIAVGMFDDMGYDAALASPPSAPSSVTAFPLDAAAWVSWQAASANGAAIDRYTVTATPTAGSPVTITTPDGLTTATVFPGLSNGTAYTFTVRAHNELGDGPDSTATGWVTPSPVDVVPPVVTITGGPAAVTKLTSAAFSFSGVDYGRTAPITYTCRLDAGAALPCVSGQAYSALSNGVHTFHVIAYDDSLNPSAEQSRTWRVDTVAPTIAAQTQPTWTLGSTMTLRYSGADSGGSGIASYAVRTRKAPYSGGFGTMSYPTAWQARTATSTSQSVARGYTYCMSVRSRDLAGNLSAWSAERCTAVPLDDRSLSASAGWARSTGTAYYAGTITTARSTGVTLTRTSVQARRISVVAMTCATCGALRVYWNGALLKTVSLVSSTTRQRQVLAALDFGSARSGTIVLRTTSTKASYVDGLALSRV